MLGNRLLQNLAQHVLMASFTGKTRIFLLRPRYRSAGRQVLFSGGGRKKNAGFFYFGTFKTLTFRGGNLMVCFTISTIPSLKNILPNID